MAKQYGKWEVIESVGEGGQAAIFRVRHVDKPKEPIRALKRLKNVGRVDRFKREIDTVNKLADPGIIKIIESDTSGSEPYLVMPYYERGNCEKAGVLKWPIEERLHFFRDVLDAVSKVHGRKIIHRDLKPANILVTDDNKPVLTDFGICFVQDGQLLTCGTEVLGPRDFIAPELLKGEGARIRSDIYSLGKVLYWLASGGTILHREDQRTGQYDLTQVDHRFEIVTELLDKMVVENPRQRLATGYDILTAFDEKLKGFRAVINYPSSTGPQPCRYCGLGEYQPMTPVKPDGSSDPIELQRDLGISSSARKLRVMVCPRCGNVQTFHIPSIKNENPWKPSDT